eukprot:90696-Alexandrium_andersonii.AAC.1
MVQPRALHTVVAWDGAILACGGLIPSTCQVLDSLETFDPAVGAWCLSSFPSMPCPRAQHAAVVSAGRLFVLGGFRLYTLGEDAMCSVD